MFMVKPKKKTSISNKKPINTKALIFALLAAILLSVWFFGYKLPALQEKRDLVQKHQKLEEIANKITAIYPTLDRKSDKSCQYSHVKFEKGNLSCDVSVSLSYKTSSVDEANIIKNKIINSLGLEINKRSISKELTTDFSFDQNGKYLDLFSASIPQLEKCFIYFESETKETPNKLKVLLICSAEFAKAEHFPIKK